jgi:hypothetical protein
MQHDTHHPFISSLRRPAIAAGIAYKAPQSWHCGFAFFFVLQDCEEWTDGGGVRLGIHKSGEEVAGAVEGVWKGGWLVVRIGSVAAIRGGK